MAFNYFEVIATIAILAALITEAIAVIALCRFNQRVRASKRIDPQDQRQTAKKVVIRAFVSGICTATGGLSLSLWSPAGLERLTAREILFSFLFFAGGNALIGFLIFRFTIVRWKFLLGEQNDD